MRREDVLATRTHKQDGLGVAHRVYYTLKGDEPEDWKSRAHRNSKALAMLIKHLSQLGMLTEQNIDDILWRLSVE